MAFFNGFVMKHSLILLVFRNDIGPEDAISLEATEVIREWTEFWHELFLLRDHEKFNQLKKLMEQLLDLRKQLISGHLTAQQKTDLRMKIVNKIQLGTRLLDLDIVPRELDGHAVDPRTSSPVHIFNRVRAFFSTIAFILIIFNRVIMQFFYYNEFFIMHSRKFCRLRAHVSFSAN